MPVNLYESFLASAERDLGRTAVIDGGKSYTYEALLRSVEGMAGVLAGTTDKEAVGIFLPTCAAFVISAYGAFRAGLGVLPVNLLAPPKDLLFALKDSGVDTIITSEVFQEKLKRFPVKLVIVEELAKLAAEGHSPSVSTLQGRPPKGADDLAVLLYTSGTTGTPKGVRLTHGNIQSNIEDCLSVFVINPEDVVLGILPLFHTFAFTAIMGMPMHAGGTLVTHPRFAPDAAISDIENHRVTMVMAVPSMYRLLVRAKAAKPADTSSLRLAVTGGEPLPPKLERSFKDAFGVELLEGYGLTEASPVVCVNPPDAIRQGTAGRALPRVEVRTVGNDGETLNAGEVGELLVRGPNVMQGYHNKPDETSEAIRDGWLHTGDMAKIDEDGYITITGRKKEMIIVAGENVFPAEVEAVLEEHPGVALAAVVGVTDEVRGESVKAVVVPSETEGSSEDLSVLESELKAFLREHLPPYKVPRVIEFRDDVPLGPSGKILKRAL